MLINLRNALMTGKRLPYDAEVEYLESTGTQWIDTGVVPTNTTGVLIECTVSTDNSRDNIVVGVRQDSGDTRYWIDFDWSTHDSFYFGFGSLTPRASNSLRQYEGERVQVGMNYQNGRICTVNGEKFSNLPISGSLPTITKSIYCFSANYSNPYTYSGKIFSLKITDGLTLLRDFIPVRKGTVGYLYDRVTRKLFGNAGTGDFVLGQDVVPVEYIESHGTEWIDTGVYGSQNLRTIFDYQLVYSGTAPVAKGLFGCYTNGMKYYLYCSGVAPSAFQVGMGDNYPNTISVDNVRHSIEFNNRTVSIDGNVVAIFNPYGAPTAYTLLLFALHNNSGGLYSMTPMRKWRVQMWDSGTPVRDYVPIRVGTDATSWEGAMMDTLTRRIYRNAGTGAFTYGNDLKYPIPAA